MSRDEDRHEALRWLETGRDAEACIGVAERIVETAASLVP